MAFDRQLDQPVQQRRIGQTTDGPQPRVHRDRGEPRDRVDLIHDEPAITFVVEAVHARHAVAPARGERAERYLSHFGGCGLGQLSWGDELRGTVLVLVGVGVKLGAGHDLAGERRLGCERTQHRHLDLASDDHLLREDLLVVGQPEGDCNVELRLVVGLAHPDGRPHVRRLHETREPEFGDHLATKCREVLALAVFEVGGLRKAGRGEHLFHRALVHPDRGAEHAGTDVGNVREFK